MKKNDGEEAFTTVPTTDALTKLPGGGAVTDIQAIPR